MTRERAVRAVSLESSKQRMRRGTVLVALCIGATSVGCGGGAGVADIDRPDASMREADETSGARDAAASTVDAVAACEEIEAAGQIDMGECMHYEAWSCGGERREIGCDCPSGRCKCDGETFAIDCSKGCAPSDSDRVRCGVGQARTGEGRDAG